jgi:hypothetical protein
MILSTQALRLIDRKVQRKLAAELDFTEYWIGKLIESNKPNGKLTLEKAIQVIMAETGLTREEILEEEPVAAK